MQFLLFLIGYIFYRKYYGHGAKDKNKYYKETEYILKPEENKETNEPLSNVRKMYRRLLILITKKGFKYTKGCTAGDVNDFLIDMADVDKSNIYNIKSMYEMERYSKKPVDEKKF